MIRWVSMAFLFILASCGSSSSTVSITLESTTAFSNTSVVDVVFIAESQETTEGILDTNGDGVPDAFVFPPTCEVTFPGGKINIPAGCGLNPKNSGSFDLGSIPTGFIYLLEVRFRDAAGSTLERGTVALTNDGATQDLVIAVNPV